MILGGPPPGRRASTARSYSWIWARSTVTIPLTGFRAVDHVRENAGALEYGPLGDAEMAEIAQLLG